MKSVPGTPASIEVRSRGPFAAGVVLWRDESHRVLATIVAKVSYALDQGTSGVVETPDPIRHADEYWDDGAADSLRFPSDLIPFKGAHEVLVVGHGYASGNRPSHAAIARIAVGELEKTLALTVPRRFDRDGQLRSGPPQTRFSLRYEVASGGAGTDNPVGIDATALTPDGGRILPRLMPANTDFRAGDHVPLVGFGPVSRSWPARHALLRTEDREWLEDPLRRPRPHGFDPRYFFTAPTDQRRAAPFHADERLILEGLHPGHARLVTNLAGIAPALRSIGSQRPLPPFVADTLYIDTDRQVASLTFRAIVPLDDERLVFELVADGDVEPASAGDGHVEEATTELDRSGILGPASKALPFAPSSEPGRPRVQGGAGGLPFRPPSPSSPSGVLPIVPPLPVAPAPPLARTPSPPPPPPSFREPPAIVSLPPNGAHVAPLEPAQDRATIGQSITRTPLTTKDRGAPEPPAKRTEEQQRADARGAFRKAFGVRGGEPSTAGASAEAVPSATKPASDGAPASGAQRSFDAAPPPGVVKAASDAAAEAATAPDASLASSSRATSESLLDRKKVVRRAIIDLVDFDPDVPNRLKRSKSHAPLLADFAPRKVDEAAASPDRGRLEILRVLSCGAPLAPGDLHGAFDVLLDDAQDFEIPLLLVEGDIKPTMDEIETLRVATNLAKPLAGSDKRVLAALALASDALAAPAPPQAETAVHLYKQLEASTRELSLPPRYLADLVARTLSEARSFKKRTLLGSPRIRAELSIGKSTVPIYLPDAVASKLPLLPSFSAVALVELRPREDASEPNADALVAFALGRVLRARKEEQRG